MLDHAPTWLQDLDSLDYFARRPGMLLSPIFLRISLGTAGGLLRPILLLNSLASDTSWYLSRPMNLFEL